eukprot:446990_1
MLPLTLIISWVVTVFAQRLPVAVYEYYNGNSDVIDHLYSTDLKYLFDRGYERTGNIPFYVFKQWEEDTTPLYGYYYASGKNHFYTINPNEIGARRRVGDNTLHYGDVQFDYFYEGIIGYVYEISASNNFAVNRYYYEATGPSVVNHYYTPSTITPSGYQTGIIAFYSPNRNYISSIPDTIFPQTKIRGGNNILAGADAYDYAPTILYDAIRGMYRMWWCAGIAGDYILYAETQNLDSPFHKYESPDEPYTYDIHLQPNKANSNAFDYDHTCDPSVIKGSSKYYMYYGGLNEQLSDGYKTTRIGVAESDDGLSWTRVTSPPDTLYGSTINPKWTSGTSACCGQTYNYGAGQPSVFYSNSYYYMTYTDTSGVANVNQNVQYVLRSTDPYFKRNVEELDANGWFSVSNSNGNITGTNTTQNGNHTGYFFIDGASTDWTVVNEKVIMCDRGSMPRKIRVRWWNINNLNTRTGDGISTRVNWITFPGHEGIGIVHNFDGSGMLDSNSNFLLDLIGTVDDGRTNVPQLFNWDLAHVGITIDLPNHNSGPSANKQAFDQFDFSNYGYNKNGQKIDNRIFVATILIIFLLISSLMYCIVKTIAKITTMKMRYNPMIQIDEKQDNEQNNKLFENL